MTYTHWKNYKNKWRKDEKELDRKDDEEQRKKGQEKEWQDDLDSSDKSQAEFKAYFKRKGIRRN